MHDVKPQDGPMVRESRLSAIVIVYEDLVTILTLGIRGLNVVL